MATNGMNIDGGIATARTVDIPQALIPRETPRWLFFAGDFPKSARPAYPAGGVDFGSFCIVPPSGKPGFMNRCLVTPCVEVLQAINKQEVPSGTKVWETVPGRDAFGRVTDTVHISLYPGEELDALERAYKHWGLHEIEALRGKKPSEVAPLKINSLMFPEWPTLPETNAELVDYILKRKDFFNKSEHKLLYHKIADEMCAGVEKVDQWMRTHIDAVHACFLLPADHEAHRTNYDPVDLHFIKRAKLQRRDKDLSTMADTQSAIAQILAASKQPQQPAISSEQFLDTLKLILAQNTQAIKESIARAEPPEKKN